LYKEKKKLLVLYWRKTMAQTNQRPLQTSLVYGLVLGVVAGVSEIALVLLLFLLPNPLSMALSRLAPVLLLLAYLYAGYQAARRTGNLFAGSLAGALTGVFGVATVIVCISLIGSLLHMGLIINPRFLLVPIDLTFVAPLASPVVRIFLTFALYGAIVGTLGGVVGKQRARY
jgi:hypothetical protein